MNRVRFLVNLVALAGPLCWSCICTAQTSVKDDELVKLTRTIIQRASEHGYFGLTELGSNYLYTDPDPDETQLGLNGRLATVRAWAKSLQDMERNVSQNPTRFKGVSFKSFLVTREVDDKGKPLPAVKVRFEVPEVARQRMIPPGTAVIEWRLTFDQNARPKRNRGKDDPDWLLVRIDQITPASAGLLFTI